MQFKEGTVVWVLLEPFPWWPAVVVRSEKYEDMLDELPLKTAKNRMVEFFNDRSRVSVVSIRHLKEFESAMHLVASAGKKYGADILKAVAEANIYIKTQKEWGDACLKNKPRRSAQNAPTPYEVRCFLKAKSRSAKKRKLDEAYSPPKSTGITEDEERRQAGRDLDIFKNERTRFEEDKKRLEEDRKRLESDRRALQKQRKQFEKIVERSEQFLTLALQASQNALTEVRLPRRKMDRSWLDRHEEKRQAPSSQSDPFTT